MPSCFCCLNQFNLNFDPKDTTMATVKKISRSVNYLPPIKTLTEWFNYAFKSSELDEVHRFPSLSGGGPGEQV